MGGQLICLSGDAVFLFVGDHRYYPPILSVVIALIPPKEERKLTMAPSVAARSMVYAGKTKHRSFLAIISTVLKGCINH